MLILGFVMLFNTMYNFFKTIKYQYIFVFSLLVFLLAITLSPNAKAQTSLPSPYSVLAVVNNDNILLANVNERIKILHLFSPKLNVNDIRLKKTIFNQLINEVLVLQDSKNYNINITTNTVNKEIESVLKQKKWTKKELYEKALKNHVGIKNLKRYFATQALLNTMLKQIGYMGASVSKQEVDNALSNALDLNGKYQYLLKEIFISNQGKTAKETQQDLNEVIKQLKDKSKFSTVAATFSNNIYDRVNGGSVGWVYETQLSDNVASVIAKTKVGSYTTPIKKEEGYYIYFIENKKPIFNFDINDNNNLDRLKYIIQNKLMEEKSNVAVKSYIQSLKDHAVITYVTPL